MDGMSGTRPGLLHARAGEARRGSREAMSGGAAPTLACSMRGLGSWGGGRTPRGGIGMKELGFEGCSFLLYKSKTIIVVCLHDERSKLNGLFGPKQAVTFLSYLTFFFLFFHFFAIRK
jgi:hypothetical protein